MLESCRRFGRARLYSAHRLSDRKVRFAAVQVTSRSEGMAIARAMSQRKLAANLSQRVATQRKSLKRQKAFSMRQRAR